MDEEDVEFDEGEFEAMEVLDEGHEEASGSESLDDSKSLAEPTRISANIASRVPKWTGVRSCHEKKRAVAAMTPHFDKWVAQTIAAHPDRVPVAKGYVGRNRWQNRGGGGSARRCKGWWESLTVYVDFA